MICGSCRRVVRADEQRDRDAELMRTTRSVVAVERAVRRYRWRLETNTWTDFVGLAPESVRAALRETS